MPNPKPAAGTSQDELLALYLKGAEDDVCRLQDLLTQLQDDAARWAECVAHMRETVHNVKGQGSSFGYPLMTRVGDSLSRLLKGLEGPDQSGLKLIAAHINTLRAVMDNDIKGGGGELGEKLAGRLEGLVDKLA